MTTFWKRGSDTLHNGTVLGVLAGFFIWKGAVIYTWLLENIPTTWMKLGTWSLPIYLLGAGALVGYIIDRQ